MTFGGGTMGIYTLVAGADRLQPLRTLRLQPGSAFLRIVAVSWYEARTLVLVASEGSALVKALASVSWPGGVAFVHSVTSPCFEGNDEDEYDDRDTQPVPDGFVTELSRLAWAPDGTAASFTFSETGDLPAVMPRAGQRQSVVFRFD